jgi:hypothetical protein
VLWNATGGRILGETRFDAAPQQSNHRTAVALIDAANAKRARKMERNRRLLEKEKHDGELDQRRD